MASPSRPPSPHRTASTSRSTNASNPRSRTSPSQNQAAAYITSPFEARRRRTAVNGMSFALIRSTTATVRTGAGAHGGGGRSDQGEGHSVDGGAPAPGLERRGDVRRGLVL